jgi:YidC/Oxa1 family membrane protein insertase
MDKNTITGLLLIMAVFIGFSIWNSPSKEDVARMQRQRDSIALVNQMEQARLADEKRKAEEQTQSAVSDVSVADSLRQRDLQGKFGVFSQSLEGEDRFITM